MASTITVITDDGTRSLQVPIGPEMTVEMIKAVLEIELQVPAVNLLLLFGAQMLTDNNATCQSVGINNGDMVKVMFIGVQTPQRAPQQQQQQQMRQQNPPAPQSGIQGLGNLPETYSEIKFEDLPVDSGLRFNDLPPQIMNNPANLRNVVLKNNHLLRQLEHINPKMAEAIRSPDATALRQYQMEQQMNQYMGRRNEYLEIQRLNNDPTNPEAQRAIMERIRNEQVEQNRQLALEHSPESFARVLMLYVPLRVQNTEIQAFIDSGAQMTIMSESCAKKCGVMRLLDTRFAGQAVGVGTAKILGKVHLAQINFGGTFFQCSFTVLEDATGDKNMEFLLGLDMLKRYQASIDLKSNQLHMWAGDTCVSVPFLSEGDLPESKGGTKGFSQAVNESSQKMDTDDDGNSNDNNNNNDNQKPSSAT
jgi:DNA damage-inducible protein 1